MVKYSKIQNPLDEFIAHGVKTVGLYQYILLVDGGGQCYIMRVASDESSMKYCKMPDANWNHYDELAIIIDSFWVSPETYDYKYIFQA